MVKDKQFAEMHCGQMVGYGDYHVIQYGKVPVPHVESTHILIRVHASSINPLDCHLRAGRYKSLIFSPMPRILGFDVAGEVVSLGSQVKHFRIGDRVIAKVINLPGGAHAEVISLPERICTLLPQTIDYLTAGGLPLAGLTALQGLRDYLRVRPGQQVLINGAGGGVGHLALQLAKVMRARVTAVVSTPHVEWATLLGADVIIDRQQTALDTLATTFDAIYDVAGTLSIEQAKALLQPQGRYVTTAFTPSDWLQQGCQYFFSGQQFATIFVRSSRMDLDYLLNLLVQQAIRLQINQVFKLEDIQAAHQYMAEKKGLGKVIIKMKHER